MALLKCVDIVPLVIENDSKH